MSPYKFILALFLLAAATGMARAQEVAAGDAPPATQSQTPFLTPEEKRAMRRNLVVKELNADAKGRRRWLDHQTVWNENGYKV
ncbi:MAG: hypothetical protein LBD89_01935, partial [Tannerellaceae bacterium]|nr:hypothetical protein [Tannerellaceae bacterium]